MPKIYGIAIDSYNPLYDSEISLKRGDFLIILENEFKEWWMIQNERGACGIVPAKCVKVLDKLPPGIDFRDNVLFYAKALCNYEPQAVNELKLVKWEYLSVLEKESPERWQVINRNGFIGCVNPKNVEEKAIVSADAPYLDPLNLYAVAISSWKPISNSDLPLNINDHLIVLKTSERWSVVQNECGSCGFVPLECVKLGECPSGVEFNKKVISYAKAKGDYNSSEINDLRLCYGEYLSVLRKETGKWQVLNNRGIVGWIQALFVDELRLVPPYLRTFLHSPKLIDLPVVNPENPRSKSPQPPNRPPPPKSPQPKTETESSSFTKFTSSLSNKLWSSKIGSKFDTMLQAPLIQHKILRNPEKTTETEEESIVEEENGNDYLQPKPIEDPNTDLERYSVIRFPVEILKKVSRLGSGHYGCVDLYKIRNKEILPREFVAVKEFFKSNPGNINEMELIAQCKHPNIVQCFGYFQVKDSTSIVLEFLPDGDLQEFLVDRNNRLNVRDALSYIQQVISGMTYLSGKKIVHRDLAARNCMLADDNKTIKINDFGLGKQLDLSEKYYMGENADAIPIYWTAMECFLRHSFNEKTDVWSCGILMWEVFARAKRPYLQLNSSKELITFLEAGKRLERPEACPKDIYKLMCTCWVKTPLHRLNFVELGENLQTILDEQKKFGKKHSFFENLI